MQKGAKKIANNLYSRLGVGVVLMLLQFAFFVFTVVYLSTSKYYIYAFLQFVSLMVVFFIVTKQENPSYKISWIIIILALPLFGGLFYILWGNKRIARSMKKKIAEYDRYAIDKTDPQNKCINDLYKEFPHLKRQVDYVYNLSGFPLWTNTKCEYYKVGEDLYESMKNEIKKAKKFILLEYFIIQEGKMWDEILIILEQKLKEGVNIKIMFDDIGCIKTLPSKYEQHLRDKGFEVMVFNPFRPRLNVLMNYRDHRKICVIDGNTAFTGGINLADEYINEVERFGHWKDTGVMIKGDAVWNFTTMFLQLWQFAGGDRESYYKYRPTKRYKEAQGYVQPFGDSPMDRLNIAENAYMQIINQAKDYVYIMTPYLILDNEMINALSMAAQSGIDVRIMTPYIADKWYVHPVTRSYYRPLLEAGVKIYEYTPGFVHAKTFVSDDNVGIVGTTNMDFRSFYLHFECGVLFINTPVLKDIKFDFVQTQKQCKEITLEHEKNVSLIKRFGRGVLKFFAPLM